MAAKTSGGAHKKRRRRRYRRREVTKRRARRGSSRRSIPASHGRSSDGCRVDGRVGVGPERPGPHQHRARARAGLAREIHGVVHAHAARLEHATRSGSRSAAGTIATTWESGRAANAPSASVSSAWVCNVSDVCNGPRRDQTAAEDDDARSLPFLQPTGDVAAGGRELSVGVGGSRRSPITSTLRPRATAMVVVVPDVNAGVRRHHPPVDVASHSSSIVPPPGVLSSPHIGGSAPPKGGDGPVRLDFRARHPTRR